jgi:cytochrome c oxidase cbb3-type subunit 3
VRTQRPFVWLLAVSSFVAFAGCDSAPADLREWKPSDHDRTEETQQARTTRGRTAAGASASPTLTLVEVTWRNQCANCHGVLGKGDGPQGAMLRAPDLTAVDWQTKVTDQQIAQVILNGKNRMPKFELPPDVVAGLVGRIRAAKGR